MHVTEGDPAVFVLSCLLRLTQLPVRKHCAGLPSTPRVLLSTPVPAPNRSHQTIRLQLVRSAVLDAQELDLEDERRLWGNDGRVTPDTCARVRG